MAHGVLLCRLQVCQDRVLSAVYKECAKAPHPTNPLQYPKIILHSLINGVDHPMSCVISV